MLYLALTVLVLICLFVWWLGWRRGSGWKTVSGWNALPEEEKHHFQRGLEEISRDTSAPVIYWHGHATLEILWAGQRILVDPVISRRIKIAPRWIEDVILDTTKRADAILLTHAHMDHFDNETLGQLPKTTLYLPKGASRFLSRKNLNRHVVVEIEYNQLIQCGELSIIPVQAEHGGWRYPWQKGLFACGYIFKNGEKHLYVAGDTAFGPHFKEIADQFHPEYGVIPIGAWSPRWFLKTKHLNPEEALQAIDEMRLQNVMPYHFGTYRLSVEAMDQPLREFSRRAYAAGQSCFLRLFNGED